MFFCSTIHILNLSFVYYLFFIHLFSAENGHESNALVPVTEESTATPQSSALSVIPQRKVVTIPKPKWHPPWKLFRVISGHLGWVRCVAVEPGNEWFATGSADRVIKVILNGFCHFNQMFPTVY